jgi:hypothetical protein
MSISAVLRGLMTRLVNLARPRPGSGRADTGKAGISLPGRLTALARLNVKANDIAVWRHNVCGHLLTQAWCGLSPALSPCFPQARSGHRVGTSTPGEDIKATSCRPGQGTRGAGVPVRATLLLPWPVVFSSSLGDLGWLRSHCFPTR